MDNSRSWLSYIALLVTLIAFLSVNYLFIYMPISTSLNLVIARLDDMERLATATRLQQPSPPLTTDSPVLSPTPASPSIPVEDIPPTEIPPEVALQDVQRFQTKTYGTGDKIVKWVIFEDPLCPWCQRFYTEMIPPLLEEHQDNLTVQLTHRLVDFIGGNASQELNMGGYCVGLVADGKYHDYMALIYNGKDRASAFKELLSDEELTQVNTCLENRQWEAAYAADKRVAGQLRVSGTPTSYLNGKLISGADADEARRILEEIVNSR